MAHGSTITDEEVAGLVERTAEASSAFVRGDMAKYLTLVTHADDYTLMAPFGGAPRRGFDVPSDRYAELARYFKAGRSELDLVRTYVSGDMVVLVAIERQRGGAAGPPGQDWSLRVTQVYRREGSEWRLAHRHADPLENDIGPKRAAAIARG